MNIRSTHTFATMDVPSAVYDYVKSRLLQAGYDHAICDHREDKALSMQGIALIEDGSVPRTDGIVGFLNDLFRAMINGDITALCEDATWRDLYLRTMTLLASGFDTEFEVIENGELYASANTMEEALKYLSHGATLQRADTIRVRVLADEDGAYDSPPIERDSLVSRLEVLTRRNMELEKELRELREGKVPPAVQKVHPGGGRTPILHDNWIEEINSDLFIVYAPDTGGADIVGGARTLPQARDMLALYGERINRDATQPARFPPLEEKKAQRLAYLAAEQFRPSYFTGPDFRAHAWVISAIRTAYMQGILHGQGLPAPLVDGALPTESPPDLQTIAKPEGNPE